MKIIDFDSLKGS